MHTKLTLARELVSCLGGIEVRLVADEDHSFAQLLRETFYDAVIPSMMERSLGNYFEHLEPGQVYFLDGILDLSYILIRLPSRNKTLVAGPCRTGEFSESRIRGILHPYGLSGELTRQIISYCRWQSALTPEKIYQLGILLGRYVLDLPEPIAHQHITYHWNRDPQPVFQPPDPYADQSRIRRIEMRYEASAALTEAVKQGNLSLAMGMIRGMNPDNSAMIRNPDPLRNAQNMCIVMNTQLRHAMEEKKIHPYRLDSVSGEIGRKIETLKTLEEVGEYYGQIIRRYCELALEKNYSHLDALTRQAVVYIKHHLTDNLTVKGTADALLVNANYLSGKFHREMGMTFTDFVNQQRTEQAAALLRHTNMQIQQIAAAVGYNNTSYFARQFLRFHGSTPRDYRSAGLL